jgi:hypothetical protein
MVEALHAGERLRRPVEAFLRQQRRPEPVARGIADADAFRRRAQALAQAGRLRGRGPERPHHLALVEFEQPASSARGTENAAG